MINLKTSNEPIRPNADPDFTMPELRYLNKSPVEKNKYLRPKYRFQPVPKRPNMQPLLDDKDIPSPYKKYHSDLLYVD